MKLEQEESRTSQSNKDALKVVAIAPYSFLPAKIGGQRGIAFFYKYFSRHVPLVCISVKNNDAALAKGYTLLKLLSNHRLRYINPLLFFTVKRVLKEQKATHLLIEHPYYGWLAILLKTFVGVKLMIHSHNIEASRFQSLGKWWWRILWWYEKYTHRQADYNFFIQEDDMQYAIQHFGLAPARCLLVTYGIEQEKIASKEESIQAQITVRKQYGIQPDEKILLFTGAFNYKPNLEALDIIQHQINPLLLQRGFQYKILVCGPWMPEAIQPQQNIIFAGFVDDINTYFKAADVFINPVMEGGGIKTKLVEALGNNANVVSTVSGAIGVREDLCNGKLLLVNNNDWQTFVEKIIIASNLEKDIPPEYFQHFYWGYSTPKSSRVFTR